MPEATQYFLREQAKTHLETARRLLAGDGQDIVYACLELRLAIEAIVYETLQAYEKSLSQEVAEAYQHWQPNKVLELLSAHDPLVETSVRVRIHKVGDDGEVIEGPPLLDGIDQRLTVSWVEKAHRSLGSFLHQRTISQLKKGRSIDEAKLRSEAARISARLEEVLQSEVYGIKLTGGLGIQCQECGVDLAVSLATLILEDFVDVQCDKCGTGRRIGMDKTTGELRYVPIVEAIA